MSYLAPIANARPFDRGAAVGDLPELIERLERLGCTVPDVDKLRRVEALQSAPPRLAGRVLDADPAELLDHAEDAALWAMSSGHPYGIATHLNGLAQRARLEVADAIRDHADDLIRQLRIPFDVAAQAARDLRGLGVQETDTAEQVMLEPAHIITAWREFRAVHARTLDEVRTARQLMSTLCGVPPVPAGTLTRINYLCTVTRTPWPRMDYMIEPDPARPMHEYWLAMAGSLHLPTCDEITDLDELRAVGTDTGLIEAAARAHFAPQANTTN